MKIIYFDMDGVLADLGAAIADYAEVPLEKLSQDAKLMQAAYESRRGSLGMYASFSTLEPIMLPEMREVMLALHETPYRLEILTSYGLQDPTEMGDQVHQGKADFLREHYGDFFEQGIISRFNGVGKGYQKQFYATPQSILLDDWGQNIREWRATGAPAVHYHRDRHSDCIHELYCLAGLAEERWG